MSWVERRFEHIQTIERGTEALWQNLTAALEEAASDFNRLFHQNRPVATIGPCPGTKGNCLTISVEYTSKPSLVFQIRLKNHAIHYRDSIARGPRAMFVLGVDESAGVAALFHDGQAVGIEEACQIVLEPVLFDPAGQ